MKMSSKLISAPLTQITCLEPRYSFFHMFLALLTILVQEMLKNVSVF